MAELDFILQAVTTTTHARAIRAILRLPKPTQVLVSVAYVREPGLGPVEKAIKALAGRATFFVGIRNGITSIQAINRLLAMKAKVYAVDTASRSRIFHPKLYFAANTKQAGVIIGSANLTLGGLHNNIEASTHLKLDLSAANDKKFANEAVNAFADMLKKHPKHVFLIKNTRHANELFAAGRLADEEIIPAPTTTIFLKKGRRDDLRPMKLTPAIQSPFKGTATPRPQRTGTGRVVRPPKSGRSVAKYLVWKSRALTERDLNIPTGRHTNPTGSMGLKKGSFTEIDQRHYFRDQVFTDLNWTRDTPPTKWERGHAKFELVIKTINYGVFELKLSHNTNRRSRSYRQRNFMTHLHWGEAKKYIAKRDLLGRVLYLYRKDAVPPEFMIEID
jgi:HKD family nuclease